MDLLRKLDIDENNPATLEQDAGLEFAIESPKSYRNSVTEKMFKPSSANLNTERR